MIFLLPRLDGRDGPGDLPRDERLAPRRPFVVEEDSVGGVNAVGLAVIDGDPIGVELGGRVGAAGRKGVDSSCGGGASPNSSEVEAW